MEYIKCFESFSSIENTIYHSTDLESLYSILMHNQIIGATPIEIDGKMYRGVSCTNDSTFIYKNREFTLFLDSNLLSEKWDLVNVDFFSTKFGKERAEKHNLKVEDEKEVFVVLGDINSEKSIKPLSKYLKGIRINFKDVKLPKDILEFLTYYNSIKIFDYKNKDVSKKYIKNDDYFNHF
jgi:hypothetical protein